jgi:hypothetical protein
MGVFIDRRYGDPAGESPPTSLKLSVLNRCNLGDFAVVLAGETKDAWDEIRIVKRTQLLENFRELTESSLLAGSVSCKFGKPSRLTRFPLARRSIPLLISPGIEISSSFISVFLNGGSERISFPFLPILPGRRCIVCESIGQLTSAASPWTSNLGSTH